MLKDRLKTLRRWLTTKKPKAPLFPERELVPELRMRKPTPDELALGIASSENIDESKEIYQLKGVSQEARDTHFYIIGASGSGKTKFLESLIKQDIENDLGFGVVDPHGDLTEDIKGYLYAIHKDTPELLQERVVLIDPTNKERVVTFNPLEITRTHLKNNV